MYFQTPASGFPGVEDDLIFSGAGSGCNTDDEDECTPPIENGSGNYMQFILHDYKSGPTIMNILVIVIHPVDR
jgi:leucine-rich repeat transmembrane neuronal protein 1/2